MLKHLAEWFMNGALALLEWTVDVRNALISPLLPILSPPPHFLPLLLFLFASPLCMGAQVHLVEARGSCLNVFLYYAPPYWPVYVTKQQIT